MFGAAVASSPKHAFTRHPLACGHSRKLADEALAKVSPVGRGKEAKLSYSAHALIENRNGLLVDLQMDVADGYAERRTALEMLDNNAPGTRRITVAGDKGYDTSAPTRSPPTCSQRPTTQSGCRS